MEAISSIADLFSVTVQFSLLSSDASQPIPSVDGISLTSLRDSKLRSIEPSKIISPIFCLGSSLPKKSIGCQHNSTSKCIGLTMLNHLVEIGCLNTFELCSSGV